MAKNRAQSSEGLHKLQIPRIKVVHINKQGKKEKRDLQDVLLCRFAETFYGVEGKKRIDYLEQRIINHLEITSALLTMMVGKKLLSVKEVGVIIGRRLERHKKSASSDTGGKSGKSGKSKKVK